MIYKIAFCIGKAISGSSAPIALWWTVISICPSLIIRYRVIVTKLLRRPGIPSVILHTNIRLAAIWPRVIAQVFMALQLRRFPVWLDWKLIVVTHFIVVVVVIMIFPTSLAAYHYRKYDEKNLEREITSSKDNTYIASHYYHHHYHRRCRRRNIIITITTSSSSSGISSI